MHSVTTAYDYLVAQGFTLTRRTLQNHIKAGLLGANKDRSGKVKSIDHAALEKYATAHLERRAMQEEVSHRMRKEKAEADIAEAKAHRMRGMYLDATEEEQRDAAVLLGIRRHLEISVPDRAKQIISGISSLLTDEQRGQLSARLPELIEQDKETIADIFDRLARAGGIET